MVDRARFDTTCQEKIQNEDWKSIKTPEADIKGQRNVGEIREGVEGS
jgi:hypothetical protein